mmetsp:Transcript_34581/g.107969  ORF Transcript_34581/g.107969 Transcript_34581/m.107969 type:complete len:204 (+) Transcript_34581:348-959(+)
MAGDGSSAVPPARTRASWPQAPETSRPISRRTLVVTPCAATICWKRSTVSCGGATKDSGAVPEEAPGLYGIRFTMASRARGAMSCPNCSAHSSLSLTPPSSTYSTMAATDVGVGRRQRAACTSRAARSSDSGVCRAAGTICSRSSCVGACNDRARHTPGASSASRRMRGATPTVERVTWPGASAYCPKLAMSVMARSAARTSS